MSYVVCEMGCCFLQRLLNVVSLEKCLAWPFCWVMVSYGTALFRMLSLMWCHFTVCYAIYILFFCGVMMTLYFQIFNAIFCYLVLFFCYAIMLFYVRLFCDLYVMLSCFTICCYNVLRCYGADWRNWMENLFYLTCETKNITCSILISIVGWLLVCYFNSYNVKQNSSYGENSGHGKSSGLVKEF